jgi:serine/threonine protein kinase/tetratricopeptide (TPR) repeat protein
VITLAKKCPECQSDNPSDSKYCKECATPLPPSEEPQVSVTETLETPTEELTRGTTFANRYEIIEELGKGGMGKVYRVEDKKIKEEVALKLIKPEISSDKKTIERFSNELKMARKISHRNVCRMYDLGEEKGTHFITMEYVPGEDLKGSIRRMGPLTAGKTLFIAKQVCEGLAEAHSLGVIHRDLKPQNIMIDKDGNARIMDFGIARTVKGKGLTGSGVMVGTPEYMSPEQAEVKEVDERSDIYSLGVILYEMVTGRVPFEGETPLGIAMKHKSEMPTDPREISSQVSEDLSRLIMRCLEKDKEKRYQTAGEVSTEIQNIEKGVPTTERIVPEKKTITSKEITVTFGLKKLIIPAVVVAALIIAAVAIWQLIPHKQTSIAVLPFADFSPQKDQEFLCDGMTDEIIAKLSILEGWKVMNMTSVMRYKNTEKDIKEIGRDLDVSTILEGRVRKEKDDIRVTAQLVDVKDGFQVWSNTYNQKLERVFDIQSDIAEKIAEALKTKLSSEEKIKIQKKPTDNVEAYNLYLQGRWFWNKRTINDYQKAIEYFERAIEIDSNYALAYAGIADSYFLIGNFGLGIAFPKAKEAAIKALEIDSKLSEAHASLGAIKLFYDGDWKGSEKELKKAIELNPNYASAHHWYAYLLSYLARFDEAIREIYIALESDPLSLAINRDVGHILYYAREYDRAADALRRAIEMDFNFHFSHHYLGLVFLEKSMYEEAIKEIQTEQEVFKRTGLGFYKSQLDIYIGIAYARMGRKDEAREILERIESIPMAYYSKAQLCFSLGENDKGFEYLDKEYEQPGNSIPSLKIDPLVDSVRSDPRLKELLRKVNLE